MGVLHLAMVQISHANKQATRARTECALQKADSEGYTVITNAEVNSAPRQQSVDVLFLNTVKLSQTNKLSSPLL